MADTAYIITRGFQEGKQITTAQKTSALFAEEPVVLGRVLRRGSRPMRISKADYDANEHNLLRLENAGAIKIQRPVKSPVAEALEQEKKVDTLLTQVTGSGAGDTAPVTQESSGAETSAAAEPPAVIVPPHPPSEDPPPPVEDPTPTPPVLAPEQTEEPAVVASQADAPLDEGTPTPVTLPMQTKKNQRRTRT